MPSYYDPGKFRRRMAALGKERLALQKKLKATATNRPKTSPKEICVRIGKEIKKLRIQKGLTQIKLAALTETSQAAIGRIESGRHNLTVKNLEKIAKALDQNIKIDFE